MSLQNSLALKVNVLDQQINVVRGYYLRKWVYLAVEVVNESARLVFEDEVTATLKLQT